MLKFICSHRVLISTGLNACVDGRRSPGCTILQVATDTAVWRPSMPAQTSAGLSDD